MAVWDIWCIRHIIKQSDTRMVDVQIIAHRLCYYDTVKRYPIQSVALAVSLFWRDVIVVP